MPNLNEIQRVPATFPSVSLMMNLQTSRFLRASCYCKHTRACQYTPNVYLTYYAESNIRRETTFIYEAREICGRQ